MVNLPNWGNVLVKKEKWEKKGWFSSLVGMTPGISNNAKHIALFNKKMYQSQFVASDTGSSDDESSEEGNTSE